MKTPREIIFARYQNAVPKLDSIRRKVVWEGRCAAVPEFRAAGPVAVPAMIWRVLWGELIWPSRRIWAGLAAVWVLMIAVNISLRDRSPAMAMKPGPVMILSFQQQERLLTELLGPNEMPVAKPPAPLEPRPRSEGRIEILTT
jgi:hypothetical protein